MRLCLICILILITSFQIVSGFQITEFCPDPYLKGDPDEYIVISGSGSLSSVELTDGEGVISFPAGTYLSGSLVIAREGEAYRTTHGTYPDREIIDTVQEVINVECTGTFRLANSADEVVLFYGNKEVQRIAWPSDVLPKEGRIHYLEDDIWDKRFLSIGQSRLAPVIIRGARVTTFVSPDCSRDVLLDVIEDTDSTILVNIYLFTDRELAEYFADMRSRIIEGAVIIEGSPPGGLDTASCAAANVINEGGIPVYMMVSAGEQPSRYRYNHAKYLVSDEEITLVTSENFNPSGFPKTGNQGNRGWGVVIESPDTAEYFSNVFSEDIQGRDIYPVICDGDWEEENPSVSFSPVFSPESFDGAVITPVISPDTSELVLDMIKDAEVSIEIEQAYISNVTGDPYRLNPFLEAALDAARSKGVNVRIILDSYWYNINEKVDNDEMVQIINTIAESEGIPVEARLVDLVASGLEKIHNKGVIVDGKKVLVSSINWNTNSPGNNREAGAIIENIGAAGYFRKVFEWDWKYSGATTCKNEGDPLKYIFLGLVIAGLGIMYYVRHMRR